MTNSELVVTERTAGGINIDRAEQLYSANYVGYYDLPSGRGPMCVFYTPNPDRAQGHDNYFGLYRSGDDGVMITNAGSIREACFSAIELSDGDFLVSRHRHDYVTAEGFMLDGGLAYTRCNLGKGPTHTMCILDGVECFMPIKRDASALTPSNGMDQLLASVRAFHNACDQPVQPYLSWPPEPRIKLRHDLIAEEWQEYQDAVAARDIVAAADALGDMVYVIVGAALEFGIPLDKCWAEIQRSNMAKVHPTTGKARKREDGKVLKPEGWTPPDLVEAVGMGYTRDGRLSIDEVKHFAAEKHKGQIYASGPFTYHLDCVHRVLLGFDINSYTYQAAAILHDVIEDTDTTYEAVAEAFGQDVADIVLAVSGFGKNRKERTADIHAKITALPVAAPVKAADRIANHMASLHSPDTAMPDLGKIGMYFKEKDDFLGLMKGRIPERMYAALEIQYQSMHNILEATK